MNRQNFRDTIWKKQHYNNRSLLNENTIKKKNILRINFKKSQHSKVQTDLINKYNQIIIQDVAIKNNQITTNQSCSQNLQSFFIHQRLDENQFQDEYEDFSQNQFDMQQDQSYRRSQIKILYFRTKKTHNFEVNQLICQQLKERNYVISQILCQQEGQHIFDGFKINKDNQQILEFIFQEINPSQIQCVHRNSAIIQLEEKGYLKQVEKIQIKENQIIVFQKCDVQLIRDISKQVWDESCKGHTKRYAPIELQQQSQNNLIDFKSDIYSFGVTLKQIIEIFREKGNEQDQMISQGIEKILDNDIVQENIGERLDCLELHTKFLDFLLQINYPSFMEEYLNKIPKILKLSAYDKNKDSKYFLEIELYFHMIRLKLQKGNQRQQIDTLDKCFKTISQNIFNKQTIVLYNDIGSCFLDLGNQNQSKDLLYKSQQCFNYCLQIAKKIFQIDASIITTCMNNINYINQRLS
ncbi:hypothetical protein ABPG73_004701 [Tetrahymena malaccensis]